MAIPNDERIQWELMSLLLSAPNAQMHCQDVYRRLAAKFPELTDDEQNVPYRDSQSHWANRVQWARQHLVDKGWLLRPYSADGRGYWKVSAKGRKALADRSADIDRMMVEIAAL